MLSTTSVECYHGGRVRLPRDEAALVRALRRLVRTDKLLTIEDAYRYCDLTGIPRRALDETT